MSNNQQAQTKIEQTFLELLEKKPISEITIKEITAKSGFNRNTFYYHYKNIPDVLESIIRKMVDEILTNHPSEYYSLEDCFLAAIRIARENKKIINNIYHSSSRAIFERHLWHICEYSIASFISSFPEYIINHTPEEVVVIRDLFKFECFGFAIDWINRGMPDDVAEKIKILTFRANSLVVGSNQNNYG